MNISVWHFTIPQTCSSALILLSCLCKSMSVFCADTKGWELNICRVFFPWFPTDLGVLDPQKQRAMLTEKVA